MIRFRLVTSIIGYLSMGFVGLMLIPLIISLTQQEHNASLAFLAAITVSFFIGRLAILSDKKAEMDELNRMESLAVVVFGWLVLALLGSIPYLFFDFNFVDSLFESMSGFTTTGSTILADFGKLNLSMFFYRSFTQWIGGLGILVIFVALLPQLAIAGRQLFFAEVSAESKEKLSPRIKDTAFQLLIWYTFLTLLCTLGLWFSGIGLIESASNAFATLAAAGFSPNGESIMGYKNPIAEWVIIVFMFLAGANFVLQVKSVKNFLGSIKNKFYSKKSAKNHTSLLDSIKGFFLNSELIAYIFIIIVATTIISFVLIQKYYPTGTSPIYVIRQAMFQCLSILTTTGSASFDYEQWPIGAKGILAILMFIGGCSGSAGGGMKVIRIVILAKYFWKVLLKNIYPEAITRIRLDNRTLRDSDILPIISFFMFYILVFFIGGTIISMLESSFVVGYSGSIACLGNIGPGFETIGPMGNFASWHLMSKLVAVFLMWAGRLEVVALMVFFHPDIWRSSRW